jgi:hypothetical protein
MRVEHMGVYLRYDNEGQIVIQPESYKKDGQLVQYIDGLIRADIKLKEAKNRNKGDSKVEKDGKLTLPDGQVYTVGSVAKTAAEKAAVIKELEEAADQWEQRAFDGTYTLSKEVRDYLNDKAKAARQEATVLKGEAVPEPEAKVAKSVSFTLPR